MATYKIGGKEGTNEDGDVGQAKGIEDSNLANYGSKEHIDLRKKAAQSDKNLAGAGQKVGLEIWRVENRRTKADTPDFGVRRWPQEDYGSFYSGDSYLVLNTYRVKDENGKDTDKLGWDVHFWLGKDSSQDEIGVAAYKAVELDDLLDDGPVQHREVQGEESALFQSYFKALQYMEGGIASGFRTVKPEEYKPRLFQVRRTRKTCRATEVAVSIKSLTQNDVFVLDAGLSIYTFTGVNANAFEKMKAGALVHNLCSARKGKAKAVVDLDDNFWKILGATAAAAKDIPPGKEEDDDPKDKPMEREKCTLFRLSDASGKLTFKLEGAKERQIHQGELDGNDAFIIDAQIEIFVWVGKKASASEKSQCMKYAMQYLADQGKPSTTPITRILEGQIHHVFGSIVPPVGAKLAPASKSATPGKASASANAPPLKKLW